MTNFFISLIDKYVNLSYTYNKNKLLLINNKFVSTLNNFYNKYLNLKFYYNKLSYKLFNFFNKTINTFKNTNTLKIILHNIRFPSLITNNKLIIRLENREFVIVYLPLMESYIKINISSIDKSINLSSIDNDLNYLTNLASLIKHTKKINKFTKIGMYYSTEQIIFKKKIKNAIKKK